MSQVTTGSASALRGLLAVGWIASQGMYRRQTINISLSQQCLSLPFSNQQNISCIHHLLSSLTLFRCGGRREGRVQQQNYNIGQWWALAPLPPVSLSLRLTCYTPPTASAAITTLADSLHPQWSWLLGPYAVSSVILCPAYGASSAGAGEVTVSSLATPSVPRP